MIYEKVKVCVKGENAPNPLPTNLPENPRQIYTVCRLP